MSTSDRLGEKFEADLDYKTISQASNISQSSVQSVVWKINSMIQLQNYHNMAHYLEN